MPRPFDNFWDLGSIGRPVTQSADLDSNVLDSGGPGTNVL